MSVCLWISHRYTNAKELNTYIHTLSIILRKYCKWKTMEIKKVKEIRISDLDFRRFSQGNLIFFFGIKKMQILTQQTFG